MTPEIKRGDYARKEGEVILREHEFDGIQEYDQKLPNWWLFTFFSAIVFFVAYWLFYYHIQVGRTDQKAIVDRVTTLQEVKQRELEKTLASLDDASLVKKWATDPTVLAAGEATFMANCAACHAADLSATLRSGDTVVALPGLPLNDHIWKYGGRPMQLFKLINEGTPKESAGNNGARMQAWGQVLQPKQIAEVLAFVISKNPEDFAAIAAEP